MSTTVDLIERACNAAATAEDRDALTTLLAHDAAARRVFIERMDLHASLQWECSSVATASDDDESALTIEREAAPLPIYRTGVSPAASRSHRFAIAASAIAAALVVACGLMVYFLVSAAPPSQPESPITRPPIATLIASSGRVVVGSGIASPGGEYASGLYSIESGSAEFLLTNRVGVRLDGATRIHMHGEMRATLSAGTASFNCPPGVVGYTVDLPGGTRVVDLGTEFSIDLSEAGRPRVHVIDGRVRIERNGESRVISAPGAVAIDDAGVAPEPFDVWRFPETAIERGTPIDTVTADRWRAVQDKPVIEGDRVVLDTDDGAPQVMFDLDVDEGSPLERLGMVENERVAADGQRLYLSWTMRGSGSVRKGWVGLSFFDSSDDKRLGELLFVGKASSFSAFSTAVPGVLPVDLDADPDTPAIDLRYADEHEHRFVVRIDFRDGPDRVAVWLDPPTPTDPDDPDSDPLPNGVIDTVDLRFDRLRLAGGNKAGEWTFGELKIGKSWRSVTANGHESTERIENSAPVGADENTAPIPQESLQ